MAISFSTTIILLLHLSSFVILTSSHRPASTHKQQPPVDYRLSNVLTSASGGNVTSDIQHHHPGSHSHDGGTGSGTDSSNSDPSHPNHGNRKGQSGHYNHGELHGGNKYNISHHQTQQHNKFNIQDHITQRDIEKTRRKGPFWKVYFAELLAACILVAAITTFFCWYNWTKRGRQRDRESRLGVPMTLTAVKFNSGQARAVRRGTSMPELYSNVNPVVAPAPLKPLKYPKACGKPKRRFNTNKNSGEIEPYNV